MTGLILTIMLARSAPPKPVVFTNDYATGTADPGLYTPDRIPRAIECWRGCSVQDHPNGCALTLAEPGETASGQPTCHCVWTCFPTLKWLR